MMEAEILNPEGTIIKIVGIGGAGIKALESMMHHGLSGAEYVVADTDMHTLARSSVTNKLQLGESGLGAGANREVGFAAAKGEGNAIRKCLKGTHLLIIVADMGGATGTDTAPVIASIARQMSILTVGVVTTPFNFRGAHNKQVMESGIAELVRHADSLIVIPNERFMTLTGDDTDVDRCHPFQAIDDLRMHLVRGITGIIMRPDLLACDFEDIRTVMGNMGLGSMGSGIGTGKQRARTAAQHAMAYQRFRESDLPAARGIAVIISATREKLTMNEVVEVMKIINEAVPENAHIFYGALYEPYLGDTLRVVVVACGIDPTTRAKSHSSTATPPPGAVERRIATLDDLREAGIDPLEIPDFLRKTSS